MQENSPKFCFSLSAGLPTTGCDDESYPHLALNPRPRWRVRSPQPYGDTYTHSACLQALAGALREGNPLQSPHKDRDWCYHAINQFRPQDWTLQDGVDALLGNNRSGLKADGG
ncbi:hypothetical protein ASPCADRAFT_205757 [Aspergillus carbonarius ITEM 5010]|uniref:Uncharacterized protein n=1 Tax=Aspergillus carbonarius (strain ITEM 5010) TaxID=602072 RepID=A0A1R3RRA7_ASPC5|nr:hypothetical protein ASPCADRAFT_205757 [Aspergillus carbonarius ITEM 5010]